MEPRLKLFPLLWIGEDFSRDAATLFGVWEKGVHNIIGVEGLDAEFVQKF